MSHTGLVFSQKQVTSGLFQKKDPDLSEVRNSGLQHKVMKLGFTFLLICRDIISVEKKFSYLPTVMTHGLVSYRLQMSQIYFLKCCRFGKLWCGTGSLFAVNRIQIRLSL